MVNFQNVALEVGSEVNVKSFNGCAVSSPPGFLVGMTPQGYKQKLE